MNQFFALSLSILFAAGTLGYLSATDTEEAKFLSGLAKAPAIVANDFAMAAGNAWNDLSPRLGNAAGATAQVAQVSGSSIFDIAANWIRSLFAPAPAVPIVATSTTRTLSETRTESTTVGQSTTTNSTRTGNTTIINNPVVERIVERTVTTQGTSGITEVRLLQGLASLKQEIIGLIPQQQPVQTISLPAFAASQTFDTLNGTSLTDITVSGVSGLTDADIPDTITASNYLPLSGGTINGAAYFGIGSGNVGVGTTSPYAKLSIHAIASETNTTLFAVGSSTASATTTLFTIDSFGRVGAGLGDVSGGTVFGRGAGVGLVSTTTTDVGNTVFGFQAFSSATSSRYSTAIGYLALASNVQGDSDSYDIEGDSNTAIGYQALTANTLGHSNVAVGTGALRNNTTGDFNTAMGTYTLYENTTGQGNIGIGLYTLYNNTTGDNNTAVGREVMFRNTTGGDNVAMGINALYDNTTGSNNIALGRQALEESVTGSNNIAIGRESSENNKSATSTVAIGYQAASGAGVNYWAQGYTMLGYNAGRNITTGADYNTFIGYQSGEGVTSGYGNTLLGSSVTVGNLTTGSGNIGIGYNTFFPSATGNNQLNIGGLLFGTLPATSTSFRLPTTGAFGVGTSSPFATLSVHGNNGSTNTALFAVGSSTASATTTHFIVSNAGNVGIGTTAYGWTNTGLAFAGSTGGAQIGLNSGVYWAMNRIDVDGTVIALGRNGTQVGSIAVTGSASSYNTTSDRRIKEGIDYTTLGITELMQLPVREFSFKADETGSLTTGFIAQELYEIFPWAVTTNGDDGTTSLGATSTPWSVDYGRITPLIVKAVQDLYTEFIALRDTVLAFADRFVSNEITATNRFCIGSTCINENDLQQLLELRNGQPAAAAAASSEPEEEVPDTEAPVITINGNNPARVEVGTSYNDLGALISDNRDTNIALRIKLDGEAAELVSIDTSEPATYIITYRATDQAGNTGEATRTVEVYDPNEAVEEEGLEGLEESIPETASATLDANE